MPYVDWLGNEIEDGEAERRDDLESALAELEARRTPKVCAALALDPLSQAYRIRLDPDEALSFARLLPGGEGIGCEALAAMIGAIDAAIPPMQFWEGNPNNGLPAHAYDVGREHSRVVYVDWPRSYAPTGFDFDVLAETLTNIAREAGADEFGLEDDGAWGFRYRFWWD